MSWYYSLDDAQLGPVEEAELKQLFEARTITEDTL